MATLFDMTPDSTASAGTPLATVTTPTNKYAQKYADLKAGKMNADQLHATVEAMVRDRKALEAEVGAQHTISSLARYVQKDKKPKMVTSYVDRLICRFFLGRLFTWLPFSETIDRAEIRNAKKINDQMLAFWLATGKAPDKYHGYTGPLPEEEEM